MTCHCTRWSSEPSSAQNLYQIGQLLQLLLHLLPRAVVIPLFLLGSLLQLLHPVFQRRNLASTGAVLGTLTTGRASRTFSFASYFINPSINTRVGVGKLGRLLPGEVRMCRITPHCVDLFVVRTPGARQTSVRMHILASFLGNDGHLTITAAWWSNWSISSSQSSCSCNVASNRRRPLSLMNWHDALNQSLRRSQ